MKFIPILLLLFLYGCSVAYTTKEDISENEYLVEAYGNAFSTEEDLLLKVKNRADELCGIGKHIIDGDFSKKDDWSTYSSTGMVISMGYMKANVTCTD